MYTRQEPWADVPAPFAARIESCLTRNERPPLPHDMPEQLRALICACWQKNTKDRYFVSACMYVHVYVLVAYTQDLECAQSLLHCRGLVNYCARVFIIIQLCLLHGFVLNHLYTRPTAQDITQKYIPQIDELLAGSPGRKKGGSVIVSPVTAPQPEDTGSPGRKMGGSVIVNHASKSKTDDICPITPTATARTDSPGRVPSRQSPVTSVTSPIRKASSSSSISVSPSVPSLSLSDKPIANTQHAQPAAAVAVVLQSKSARSASTPVRKGSMIKGEFVIIFCSFFSFRCGCINSCQHHSNVVTDHTTRRIFLRVA